MCGCDVSRNVCNCDMFNVANVYHNYLKFCVNGRRYICCSECNDVSNDCNDTTPCLVRLIGTHSGEVMYIRCVCFGGELGFMNCDNICKCVVNKQFELLEFVFDSVYVDLQYNDFSHFYCWVCVLVLCM